LAWEPATARGSSRVADRLPTLAAPVPKSTGGVPVRTKCNATRGADTRRSLLPPVRSRCILSFTSPFAVPARPRERTECTGRQMFGPDCQGSLGWVTQAARCFGCRTESSRSTTTEPSQTTSLRLLRSRRLVVSQVAMLEKPTPPTGMHPQFPSLKLSTATVINFFEVVADTRITDQAHGRCGSFTADVGRAHYARQAHQRASATANRCARGTACTADPTRLATHSSA
jgi:hypothetical protein